ncbi:MAG: GTP cyclohydrolase I [Polyangiaceae bacterium]
MAKPDRKAAAAAIDAFLLALGRDPGEEPDLLGTGERVARAYADELCAGYDVDVAKLLADESVPGHTDLVVLRDTPVSTTCPHHLLPATGVATVAFAPAGRIVGLGTMASLVQAFARRLTLQERVGEEVASALVRELGATWAACRLVLRHGCLEARGERSHGSRVETFAFAGTIDDATKRTAMLVLGGGA